MSSIFTIVDIVTTATNAFVLDFSEGETETLSGPKHFQENCSDGLELESWE